MSNCPLCSFTGTVTEIRIHLRDLHEEIWYPCEECDLRLIKEDNLAGHYRNYHYCLKDCYFCGLSFTNVRSCVTHEKSLHRLEMGVDVPSGYRPATNYQVTIDELINHFGLDISRTTRLPSGEYISFYDIARKTPVLVLELLTRDSVANVYDVRPPYEPDQMLGDLQLTEVAVNNMNLDVSHLAAASCHRSSEEAYRSTFLWRHLIGLESSINRGPLHALEYHQLRLTDICDKLMVITALHYDQRNVPIPSPGIGRMSKPDGVAKVMVRLYQNRVAIVDSFYVPNQMIPSQSIIRFRKNVDELEALIGRQLLNGYGDKWTKLTDVEATRYRCSEDRCRFLCELESELEQHYLDAHSHAKCLMCKRTFPTEEEKEDHILAAHNFPCDQCDKVFPAKRKLERHEAVHSPARPFICPIGSSSFKTKDQLSNHVKNHGSKNFKCPLCSVTFNRNGNLTEHLVGVHQQLTDLPRAQMTPKVSVSSNGKQTTIMKGHRSSTSKLTIITCPTCGKNFSHRGKFNDHLASHSEDRPLACRFCGATFKTKKGVQGHEAKSH